LLFDWNAIAAPASVQDIQLSSALILSGEGLWVCLVSSGKCTASVPGAGPAPAGAALILPPQTVPAGHLILSRAPLALAPAEADTCHLLCVQLTGQAAGQFLSGLRELPFLAKGGSCPAAAELMDRLAEEKETHSRARSQLAYALLCELADADSAAPALPPLVQAAIEDIRANYAGLYGVEELSERLGVSKSHLVRTFTAAIGVPPGRYLTTVRIEAAQRLLLHREYTLDVVASLCGFSGANYLCRVFKKETGQSPAQWRAMAGHAAQSGLSPEESLREQELYI
jgi:AraC-like DNA-binding protein